MRFFLAPIILIGLALQAMTQEKPIYYANDSIAQLQREWLQNELQLTAYLGSKTSGAISIPEIHAQFGLFARIPPDQCLYKINTRVQSYRITLLGKHFTYQNEYNTWKISQEIWNCLKSLGLGDYIIIDKVKAEVCSSQDTIIRSVEPATLFIKENKSTQSDLEVLCFSDSCQQTFPEANSACHKAFCDFTTHDTLRFFKYHDGVKYLYSEQILNKNHILKNSTFTQTGSLFSVTKFDWTDSTGYYEEYWINGNIRKSGRIRFLLDYRYVESYADNDSANVTLPAEPRMFDSTSSFAPIGEWSAYYPDAALRIKGNFILVNHKFTDQDGCIWFYPDPEDLDWSEDFKLYDVVKNGSWIYYHPSGKEIQIVIFNKGNIIKIIHH